MYFLFFLLWLITIVLFIMALCNVRLILNILSKKKALIGLPVLSLIFFVLFVVLSPANKSTPKNTAPLKNEVTNASNKEMIKVTATISPLKYDTNGFPEDAKNVTVEDISKTPSVYEYKKITFTCLIANFVRDQQGDQTAINCYDGKDTSSFVQIDGSGYDTKKLHNGDSIIIYGQGNGIGKGKNGYGFDITEPLVMGIYINDITSNYNNAK